ncbi:ABC transporter C family member 9 isoform X2 [Cryptomeria japonica]|uniref:ABC transporter C family member 9 isoform X2 n=1 Tax=Cryptomeria japonica TaxID=3369 RepID=UPI0027D9ED5B|nr:ABC transporter C family member 9 isoform X2 [Cryptomeria japonica]
MPNHSISADISDTLQLHGISKLTILEDFLQRQKTSPFFGFCTEETIAIVLHLSFLCIFLIKFVWGRVVQCFVNGSTGSEQRGSSNGPKKDMPTNASCSTINFGFTYKVTLGCCTCLLACYSLSTLWVLYGNQTKCAWHATVLVSDVVQTLAWSIMFVSIFTFRRTICRRIPIFLRIWLICSCIESIFTLVLDIYSAFRSWMVYNDLYMDFFTSLLSIFLLCIAIGGNTGMYTSTRAIEEPLLDSNLVEHAAAKKESAYAKASLFELVTFSWLNPLLAIGIKKPLEFDDIPNIAKEDSTHDVYCFFSEKINMLKQKDPSKTPSMTKVVFLFMWKKVALNAIFAVVYACVSFVGPYLIDDFVSYLTKKPRATHEGYILACTFFFAKVIETASQRRWIFGSRQLGMRLRAALTAHIYRKGMHLSIQARQSHTSGELINYMSVDVQRIGDFTWYLNTIWMLPIQILLAICILYKNVGLASLVGFAATLAVMVGNIPITRIQRYFQSRIMESKDERMKSTSEILRNIKILKLQAWDMKYAQKLEALRKLEYNWLKKSVEIGAASTFLFSSAPAFISATTFIAAYFMGIPLTSGRVLSALATFRILQEPIYTLPDLFSVLAQAKVSLDRVTSYLQEQELQADAVEIIPMDLTELAIEIEGGDFSWDPFSGEQTLKEIHLQVKRGMRVAVCGTVGSGKSSLLSCILGEIPKTSGIVKVSGSKAYVPQSPWIQSGNIRENILFGSSFENDKYDRIVKACALNKDLELFPHGDQTEIGERGINMSGGQKQRIQIARAFYQNADIYLMDDPFSAVDAHTGTHLFEECLTGFLCGKTLIYVTHQVDFLASADLILVMQNGKITQAGKYDELLQEGKGFEALVGAHNQALEAIVAVDNLSSKGILQKGNVNYTELSNEDSVQSNIQMRDLKILNSEKQMCKEVQQETNAYQKCNYSQITQDEERETGRVSKKVYWSYLTAVYGGGLVPIILISQIIYQGFYVGSGYWMAWASPLTLDMAPIISTGFLILVYVAISIGGSIFLLIRTFLLVIVGLLTSQKLFLGMLYSIFRAPMFFFDRTPAGRILNRASTDQSVVDLEIAARLGWFSFAVIHLLGTVTVMSGVAWQIFIIFIPVTAIFIWFQQYYIPTARELSRLVGIRRAPVIHHFAESLSGAATVRAFNHELRFIERNLSLVDDHSRMWFHTISSTEWLAFRLNFLSNLVFVFSLAVVVSLPEDLIDPSIAGLAVTYALGLNSQQAAIIWNLSSAENKMISVERILQYSQIPCEAPLVIEESRPALEWPSNGIIFLENLQVTKPLVRVLHMVDGEGMPMGFIYEAMDRAKEAISHYYRGNTRKCEILWRIIDRRWTNQLHQPIHASAYFLNPKFYFSDSFRADEEVMAGVITCIDNMTPDPELKDKVLDELEIYKNAEGRLFSSQLAIDRRGKQQPDLWWENYGAGTPNLQKIAICVLSQPCNAFGCERNWSVF